ncbi:MAG: J domain-containing protein [Chloroflexota bacterium]|nr:J domain-containing protein [Chloroflexota bacterium]
MLDNDSLLLRVLQRWMGVAQDETNQEVEALQQLLMTTADPAKLLAMMGQRVASAAQSSGAAGQSGVDPYRILGLDRSASDDEVKHRYRELLLKLHPDTAGVEGTETLLQLVMVAYSQIERERGWR